MNASNFHWVRVSVFAGALALSACGGDGNDSPKANHGGAAVFSKVFQAAAYQTL